jgi:hypothetical protein
LKRKYDDSDVSEYDDSEGDSEDDFDDDDDPPPPPKKRKRGCRSSEDSTVRIKKRIKKYLLQLEIILPFKEVLLTKGAFSEIHWRKLYEQLGDKDECGLEKVRPPRCLRCRGTRPPRSPSHLAAHSALVIGETSPFTSTILLAADDEANVVAIGNLVNTLEEYRNGNDDFVIPLDVASCFAKGDLDKAWEFVIREYNSIQARTAGCYACESAKEVAAEVIEKYGLSSSFPTFEDSDYEEHVSFTSAEDIKEMCELPREGLDARVKTFLNESTALVKGSDAYENALLMRKGSILRIGNIMKGSVKLLYNGYAALAPLADGSYAIVTMGTPEMVEIGQLSRIICPGAAIRNRGDRYDNESLIPFDRYLLVSPTRSLVFNTNAWGQSNKLDDDTYA